MKNNEASAFSKPVVWLARPGRIIKNNQFTVKWRQMHHYTAEGWISIVFGNQIMKQAVMHHCTEYVRCTMFLNVGYELLWMFVAHEQTFTAALTTRMFRGGIISFVLFAYNHRDIIMLLDLFHTAEATVPQPQLTKLPDDDVFSFVYKGKITIHTF